MKPKYRALATPNKDNTRTILVIGVVLLFLQLAFHLTVDAKLPAQLHFLRTDSLRVELVSPFTVEDGMLVKHADIYFQDKALEIKMYKQVEQLTRTTIK